MNNKQGANAEKLFSGKATTKPAVEVYGYSAELFAHTIKESIPPGTYTLADLGSHGGDFMKEVLDCLPEYNLCVTAIDVDKESLGRNSAEHKILADLSDLSHLQSRTFDMSIMRYSLVWNNWDKQKMILDELLRITKNLIIIQNLGADSKDPTPFRSATDKLFHGAIPALERDDFYWSSAQEIEDYLRSKKVELTAIEEKRIEDISIGYGEKYNLTDLEKDKVREILQGTDYAIQSTWLIKPRA